MTRRPGSAAEMAQAIIALPEDFIAAYCAELRTAWSARRSVVVIGNGGSAATADHHAADLVEVTSGRGGRPIRALAPAGQLSLFTAQANDYGYAASLERSVDGLLEAGDILVAVSCSGRSPNVIRAARLARDRGCLVVAWTGMGGGDLGPLADLHVEVASEDFSTIEVTHLALAHLVRGRLELGPPP
jgi:D-sedoheptulose 7-phosphate isomerase